MMLKGAKMARLGRSIAPFFSVSSLILYNL